jgi:hypothetical protein
LHQAADEFDHGKEHEEDEPPPQNEKHLVKKFKKLRHAALVSMVEHFNSFQRDA